MTDTLGKTRSEPVSTPGRDAWRRLGKNRLAMLSLGFFTLMVLLCYTSPIFYPYSPTSQPLSLGATAPLAKAIERAPMARPWKIDCPMAK